jgi:hypothetical protein
MVMHMRPKVGATRDIVFQCTLRRCERLCNAFGVKQSFMDFSPQGAPFDELRATLGFGVQPLRGITELRYKMFAER